MDRPVTSNGGKDDEIDRKSREHLSECRDQVIVLRGQFQIQNQERQYNCKDAVNEGGEPPRLPKDDGSGVNESAYIFQMMWLIMRFFHKLRVWH
jgi:hypothetical protein